MATIFSLMLMIILRLLNNTMSEKERDCFYPPERTISLSEAHPAMTHNTNTAFISRLTSKQQLPGGTG
jgi:hypothetical protein